MNGGRVRKKGEDDGVGKWREFCSSQAEEEIIVCQLKPFPNWENWSYVLRSFSIDLVIDLNRYTESLDGVVTKPRKSFHFLGKLFFSQNNRAILVGRSGVVDLTFDLPKISLTNWFLPSKKGNESNVIKSILRL